MASLENSSSPLEKNYHQSFIVFQKLQSREIITNSLRQFDDIEIPAVQEEQEEEE